MKTLRTKYNRPIVCPLHKAKSDLITEPYMLWDILMPRDYALFMTAIQNNIHNKWPKETIEELREKLGSGWTKYKQTQILEMLIKNNFIKKSEKRKYQGTYHLEWTENIEKLVHMFYLPKANKWLYDNHVLFKRSDLAYGKGIRFALDTIDKEHYSIYIPTGKNLYLMAEIVHLVSGNPIREEWLSLRRSGQNASHQKNKSLRQYYVIKSIKDRTSTTVISKPILQRRPSHGDFRRKKSIISTTVKNLTIETDDPYNNILLLSFISTNINISTFKKLTIEYYSSIKIFSLFRWKGNLSGDFKFILSEKNLKRTKFPASKKSKNLKISKIHVLNNMKKRSPRTMARIKNKKKKCPYVELWNTLPNGTKHKDVKTNTYKKLRTIFRSLRRGTFFKSNMFYSDSNQMDDFSSLKFSDKQIIRGIKRLNKLFETDYWPEDKKYLPKNLMTLLFNPRTHHSYFLSVMHKPPRKIEKIQTDTLHNGVKWVAKYLQTIGHPEMKPKELLRVHYFCLDCEKIVDKARVLERREMEREFNIKLKFDKHGFVTNFPYDPRLGFLKDQVEEDVRGAEYMVKAYCEFLENIFYKSRKRTFLGVPTFSTNSSYWPSFVHRLGDIIGMSLTTGKSMIN